MAAGLFYVYTDPGTVDEAEFHDWYDHEHGPARLTVPGLGPAYRYRALDEHEAGVARPVRAGLLASSRPEYKALGAMAPAGSPLVAPVWSIVEGDSLVFNRAADGEGPRPGPRSAGQPVLEWRKPPYAFVQVQG